jgi:hypothetical protein
MDHGDENDQMRRDDVGRIEGTEVHPQHNG